MNNPKPKPLLFILFGLFLVATVVLLVSYRKKTSGKPSGVSPNAGQQKQSQTPPTLSPQQIEIISKIVDHPIIIEAGGFSPSELTIKTYDQVTWTNKDTKEHNIAGKGWGDVTINPNESFTQAFNLKGTYSYSCTLSPELKGTIIVE